MVPAAFLTPLQSSSLIPPVVDIVMPCRNAAATLPACLNSIAAQTGPAIRLIAVDDGSTDATPGLLRAFANRHPATLVLETGGAGIVAALNLGLAHSTAPLVARMDADDTMHPERIARQAAFMNDRPDIGVAGCRVEEDGFMPGFTHYLQWSNRLLEPGTIATARFIESPMAHPSVCFRRSVLDAHGGYRDGPFPEDYELWLRWMEAGVRFAKVDQCLLRWNDPPERLTRQDPRYRVEAFFAIKIAYLARWLDRHSRHDRRVWVWGAGYATRKRLRSFKTHGITIENYIDIDPRKIGQRTPGAPVVGPEALPGPDRSFVLAAVGNRGARDLIAAQLQARGYQEGHSFLCIA